MDSKKFAVELPVRSEVEVEWQESMMELVDVALMIDSKRSVAERPLHSVVG